MDKYSDIWRDLEQSEIQRGEKWSTRLVVSNPVRAYFAMSPNGLRSAQIQFPKSLIANVDFPTALGFQIEKTSFNSDDKEIERLCLLLTNEDFVEIYKEVMANLMDTLKQTTDVNTAFEDLLKKLNLLQKFFQKGPGRNLSLEGEIGLIGELYFLKNFMMPNVGLVRGLSAWKGPLSGLHDFETGSVSIEIKTTPAEIKHGIKIHNEAQLDNTRIGGDVTSLYLCVVLLKGEDPDGMTLAELVKTIRDEIESSSSVNLNVFNDLLIQSNYLDDSDELLVSEHIKLFH